MYEDSLSKICTVIGGCIAELYVDCDLFRVLKVGLLEVEFLSTVLGVDGDVFGGGGVEEERIDARTIHHIDNEIFAEVRGKRMPVVVTSLPFVKTKYKLRIKE